MLLCYSSPLCSTGSLPHAGCHSPASVARWCPVDRWGGGRLCERVQRGRGGWRGRAAPVGGPQRWRRTAPHLQRITGRRRLRQPHHAESHRRGWRQRRPPCRCSPPCSSQPAGQLCHRVNFGIAVNPKASSITVQSAVRDGRHRTGPPSVLARRCTSVQSVPMGV